MNVCRCVYIYICCTIQTKTLNQTLNRALRARPEGVSTTWAHSKSSTFGRSPKSKNKVYCFGYSVQGFYGSGNRALGLRILWKDGGGLWKGVLGFSRPHGPNETVNGLRWYKVHIPISESMV